MVLVGSGALLLLLFTLCVNGGGDDACDPMYADGNYMSSQTDE